MSDILSGDPTTEPVRLPKLKLRWDNGGTNHEVSVGRGGYKETRDMAAKPQTICRDTQGYLLPEVKSTPDA